MKKKTGKHLVIDARMYGTKHAGIGRYVQELVLHLPKYLPQIKVSLICHPNDSNLLDSLTPLTWHTVPVLAPHYSMLEQINLKKVLNSLHPDLVHFPHFNFPVSYRGRFVVTIHDILWHKQKGATVTTLPAWQYWPKYAAYRFVIKKAITKSVDIITPSEFVKTDLIHTFNLDGNKVVPVHEGVSAVFIKSATTPDLPARKPYFIYTGSFYPHKNIKRLVQATKILNQNGHSAHLYLAGSRSTFSHKIAEYINKEKISSLVSFLGFIPDDKLVEHYRQATAFVFPSLSEGFGLPGLEAMACGCPVLVANSTSLPEIYGSLATYFDPTSTTSLVTALTQALHQPPTSKTRQSYRRHAHKFSWDTTAKLTAKLYEKHLS